MSAPAGGSALGVRDRAALAEALTRAAERFATLLRGLDDGDAGRPVPGLDWTAAETAAHVVTVVRRALGDLRRGRDRDDTSRLNALCLGEYAERDPRRLADDLVTGMRAAVGIALPRFPDDLPVPFHGGRPIRLLSAYGVMLADLLVHGHDVAAATDRPWAIPPDDAALGVQAMLEVAPAWADPAALPDHPVEFLLRLPPPSPTYLVTADPAGLAVTATAAEPGAADPVGMLLGIARRVPSGDPAVRGVVGMILPL